eukprot:356929-Chlamydomonas_euryale.AAC.4
MRSNVQRWNHPWERPSASSHLRVDHPPPGLLRQHAARSAAGGQAPQVQAQHSARAGAHKVAGYTRARIRNARQEPKRRAAASDRRSGVAAVGAPHLQILQLREPGKGKRCGRGRVGGGGGQDGAAARERSEERGEERMKVGRRGRERTGARKRERKRKEGSTCARLCGRQRSRGWGCGRRRTLSEWFSIATAHTVALASRVPTATLPPQRTSTKLSVVSGLTACGRGWGASVG